MFKQKKIKTKFLITLLLVSILSQAIIAGFSYSELISLTNYSQNLIKDLGNTATGDSKSALKDQSEEYLLKLANEQAESVELSLQRVSDEVSSLASSTESLYKSSKKFTDEILPMPEETSPGVLEDVNSASGKIYAVDRQHSNLSQNIIVPFNTALSSTTNSNDRPVPINIKNEMALLGNMNYIIKPIYISQNNIDNIFIGTTSGIVYDYSIYSSENKYDPITRTWFKDAKDELLNRNDKACWQETYTDIRGNTCITCSKAFKDANGNIAGVVGIDMLLSTIQDDVLDLKAGQQGYSFVVNSDGKIIIHPDYYKEGFIAEPLTSDVDQSYKDLINEMKNGQKGVLDVSINNSSYYAGFSPLEQTGWSIAILGDLNEITAPMVNTSNKIDEAAVQSQGYMNGQLNQTLFRFSIIFTIFIILAIFLSSKTAKSITKPILKLVEGTKKIGKGNLRYKIQINSNDEIGELATSFNKMSANLKKYMENLKATTAEKERIDSELSIAKTIQENMLPCIFPPFPTRDDFDIYATMNPAREIGGDFYDFFLLDENHIAIVIADVSGKGVPAALFMVIAKTLIKNQTCNAKDPAKVFEIVNNQLCENNKAEMFVTAFMGILNIQTGVMTYANAGHCPPLIYRNNKNFEFLKVKPGFVLAGMENTKYKNDTINIQPGDMIYLYTDGVTEANNINSELFSEKRLKTILNDPHTKRLDITRILEKVKNEIDLFSTGTKQSDDITMLLLKYTKHDFK